MKKIKHLAFKLVFYVVGICCVAGGLWWGYKLYRGASGYQAAIEKVEVGMGDVELKFQEIGDIYPRDTVEVSAKVGGRIEEVFVREGERVVKGARLAVVRPGQSDADKFLPVDVNAPIDGTVMRCEGSDYSGTNSAIAKVGQRISGVSDSANPTCLMQVADLTRMLVKLSVSEMEVSKIRSGMPVKVSVDAMPALSPTGKVAMISPQAEKDNRSGIKSFRVEIDIDQKDLPVRPGMTARIEAVLNQRKNVLKMPLSALFSSRGEFVYMDIGGGKARKIQVETGLRNETEVEILSGVKKGDSLYTERPNNVEEANDKM